MSLRAAMNLGVERPWALVLLVGCIVPLLLSGQRKAFVGSVSVVPDDRLSTILKWGLRAAGALAAAMLAIGLAGPYRAGEVVSRTGTGAQIVILLDRSGSMNDTFAGVSPQGGEESKATATKRILKDFIGRRPHDLDGVAAFSTSPMMVVPLTDHHDAVKAAIDASDRPGLDFTNLARGLGMALSMFATDRPDEHHVILLVSDGGAVIESHAQDQLRAEFKKFKTDLYFLFLRTAGSKGMFDKPGPDDDSPQAMPERYLNLFFQTLDIPYKAFQAENPQQVEDAIHAIDNLERFPITFRERLPRHDLTSWAYVLAAVLLAMLAAAKLVEVRLVPRRRGGVGLRQAVLGGAP